MYGLGISFTLFFCPQSIEAATYKDIPKNHPSFEAIDFLSEKEILSGFTDQTFRPNEQVTRGQATKMIVEALERQNYKMKEVISTPIYFSDVPINSWYYPYATKMSATKYMSGYGNHAYRLHQPIRRDEFSKILIQSFQLPLVKKEPYYQQVNQKLWSYPFIQAVTYYNIVPLQKKGFNPSELLTRGEVARMLFQSIQAVEKHEVVFQGVNRLNNHPNMKIQAMMKKQEESRRKFVSEKNVPRFSTFPSVKTPYRLGALTTAYENQLLGMTQYLRSLVGLNQPLTITEDFRSEAQAAALVSALNGKISHYPSRPPGLSESLFVKGRNGAETSNLASGFLTGEDSLMYGYMMDEDVENRQSLGHRRWMLSPSLKSVGYGEAVGISGSERFYAMKVSDGYYQDPSIDAPSIIAWPTPFAFPKKLFVPPRESLALPWSISLSPNHYKQPNIHQVTVELLRVRDGKKFTFSKQKSNDGYFTINNGLYGNGGTAIIFQPSLKKITPLQKEEIFIVKVRGLIDRQGRTTTIEYPTLIY